VDSLESVGYSMIGNLASNHCLLSVRVGILTKELMKL
jgi:hypothetical protein